MKKIILLFVAVMLTFTINAAINTNNEFDGSLTIITQFGDGIHNVQLKWEDLSSSSEYFTYIITSGNSDDENNYLVKGYTSENSYAFYNKPNLANVSTFYNVYKMSFKENVDLAEIIPDAGGEQFKASLTWSQIKELLRKKSNNIWKIRRNNIPTDNE